MQRKKEAQMIQQRHSGKVILANFMVFLVLFNVSWVASLVTHDVNRAVFLLFAVPFTLFVLTRLFLRKSYVIVSLYILITAVTFLSFLPLDAFLIVLTFMAGALFYNFYAWKNGEFEPRLLIIVFYTLIHFALMFGFLRFVPYPEIYQTRLVFSYILIIALFVLQMQVNNLDFRIILQQNRGGGVTVLRQLVKVNNLIGLLFIFAIIVISLLSVFAPIHLIPRFFNWILSFRPGFGYHPSLTHPDDVMEFEITDLDVAMGHAAGFRLIDDFRARMFQDIPVVIIAVYVIAVCMLILAAVFFIRLIIRFIRKKSKLDKDTGTIEESIGGSLLEDLKALLPVFGGRIHPVRKAYAKKVNKHISLGIPIKNKDATNVIAAKIRAKEDIDGLTAEYELIRYGRCD